MDTSKVTPELFAALAAAQAEVENAAKNAANPHFRSKYADLAEVLNTVRPVFSRHGLSILQSTAFDGSLVTVTTAIAHASGGIITSAASCVPAKADAQGVGSATTHLRRYGLAAMAGVAQEDDDGNAAAHDSKPTAITEKDRAAADDFANAIREADESGLVKLGKELAGAGLPPALLKSLRELYGKRKSELAA